MIYILYVNKGVPMNLVQVALHLQHNLVRNHMLKKLVCVRFKLADFDLDQDGVDTGYMILSAMIASKQRVR